MPRPATRSDVVAAVRSLPAGLRFVGIDGFGAAGKSTLALDIAARVPDVSVVHLDDFQGVGITEWDWRRLGDQVITPLLAGRPADYDVWAWGEAAPRGTERVDAGGVVVIEGVSATRREAEVPWDLTVWVDAPEPLRRARAVERDGPATEAIWREHWIPPEQAYAERERPAERVDLVVDGAVEL